MENIQVFTTTGTKEEAKKIAKVLVEKRLAACVQIVGPILSTYRWKRKVITEEEWRCSIKTHRGLYDDLESAVKELHQYQTPEIVAVPIVAGSVLRGMDPGL